MGIPDLGNCCRAGRWWMVLFFLLQFSSLEFPRILQDESSCLPASESPLQPGDFRCGLTDSPPNEAQKAFGSGFGTLFFKSETVAGNLLNINKLIVWMRWFVELLMKSGTRTHRNQRKITKATGSFSYESSYGACSSYYKINQIHLLFLL